MTVTPGALDGVRVLDLTRVLAGPTATQILGDLGADVIKIERPGEGDETRAWGPPYLIGSDGTDTAESAYYLSVNRNKRSLAVDLGNPEGRRLVRRLAARADVLIENFKVGTMARWSLGYDDLRADLPRLIYCSISAFGQTGPYADRPGYDFLVQGLGGVMSITGEPGGPPMKVGVAVADVVCGLYAAVAVLAALNHRQRTGTGQYIDLSLLDTQVSWLANQGLNYLTSGVAPERLGNTHPNIVPYQVFAAADGHIIVAVGNDAQFRRLCAVIGRPDLATDPRFTSNARRVRHRDALVPVLQCCFRARAGRDWLERLEASAVPAGPVNTVDQVFADPQVVHRGMAVALPHPLAASGMVSLIASPLRLSASPVCYRRSPPRLGEHTDDVLSEILGADAEERRRLRDVGAI